MMEAAWYGARFSEIGSDKESGRLSEMQSDFNSAVWSSNDDQTAINALTHAWRHRQS